MQLCNTPRLCLAFVLPRDQVSVLFCFSTVLCANASNISCFTVSSSPHELLVEIMAALQNVDVLSWCIHSFCAHGKNSTHDETMADGLVSYPSNPTTYYLFTNPNGCLPGMTLTTTSSLSQYACCNAYNIISLHHLPSIYKNHIYMHDFRIIISKCKLGCHHNVCVLYYIFLSRTSYLISMVMTISTFGSRDITVLGGNSG